MLKTYVVLWRGPYDAKDAKPREAIVENCLNRDMAIGAVRCNHPNSEIVMVRNIRKGN